MGSQQQKEQEDGGVVKRRKVAKDTTDVTMDLDVLDCPICCHPLRPPIYECTAGHIICSSCLYKLSNECRFCCVLRVFKRCDTVELIVESTKVACSNDIHGCTARITYYQKEDHEKACAYAPCFCPIVSCSFSGPTTKFLDHLSSTHNRTVTKVPYKKVFGIHINVGSTILKGEDGQLFYVNMTLESLGAVISVCCIQPHMTLDTESKFKCQLTFTQQSYFQATELLVSRTNLSDGWREACKTFIVPKSLLCDTGASATVKAGMMVTCVLMPQEEPSASCGVPEV